MARRARRTRVGSNLSIAASNLADIAYADKRVCRALFTADSKKLFGYFINQPVNIANESTIDMYIDKDAYKVTHQAIKLFKSNMLAYLTQTNNTKAIAMITH
jgi:hypothetical protein